MSGADTILIVDDDREIAGAIEIYLAAEGYRVLTAADGMEALGILEREPAVSLIIMDIMMPGMDGMRATMKIREERNIPIIMLSAKSEDYDKAHDELGPELMLWFRERFGAWNCHELLEGDISRKATLCPIIVEETYIKLRDMLEDAGVIE